MLCPWCIGYQQTQEISWLTSTTSGDPNNATDTYLYSRQITTMKKISIYYLAEAMDISLLRTMHTAFLKVLSAQYPSLNMPLTDQSFSSNVNTDVQGLLERRYEAQSTYIRV